mgnify:CR=1 FL=1
MKDQDFLIWIHQRLHIMHGEDETIDYMHKLRAVIKATPPDAETPNTGIETSMQDLLKKIRPPQHKWDETGEKCINCGDKDWVGCSCSGKPNAEAHGKNRREVNSDE